MRIGLDIDGVLCNFLEGIVEKAKHEGVDFVSDWKKIDTHEIHPNFKKLFKKVALDEVFWLSLEPIAFTKPMDFEVSAYITSRPIRSEVTAEWLKAWGYPSAKVITVDHPSKKAQHVWDLGLDCFVDDLPSTCLEVNAGKPKCGILMQTNTNKSYWMDDRMYKIWNLGAIKKFFDGGWS